MMNAVLTDQHTMLSKFRQSLTSMLVVDHSEPFPDNSWITSAAATALLIEAASADEDFDQSELQQIEHTLETVFNIDVSQIEQILVTAQENLDHATCLHEITSVINSNWDMKAKVDLIEALWKVVLTDQQIDSNEQHLMRKIKGLLHIPQSEYIAAKMRAREVLQP